VSGGDGNNSSDMANSGNDLAQNGGDMPKSTGSNDDGLSFSYNNLAGAFTIIDHPHADEGNGVMAIITLFDGDHAVTDATLTVNNVPVHSDSNGRFFLYNVPGLTIAPGSRVNLVATSGTRQHSVSFDCPRDVTLTAPAEGATLKVGDQLSVAWSRDLGSDDPFYVTAELTLDEFNFAANRNVEDLLPAVGPRRQIVERGTTQATFTVPQHEISGTNTADGYSVQLWVPGHRASDAISWCTLLRRVHVHVK
jgi:hypothetical protein